MAMNAHNGSAGYSFGAREGVGDGVETVSLSETGVVSFDPVQTGSITAIREALVNCHDGEDLGAISHLEVGSNTAPVMAAAGDEASASRGDGNGTGARDESCAKTPNEPRVMSGFGTSTGIGAAPASVTSSPPTAGDDAAAAYAFDVGVPVHLDSAGELVQEKSSGEATVTVMELVHLMYVDNEDPGATASVASSPLTVRDDESAAITLGGGEIPVSGGTPVAGVCAPAEHIAAHVKEGDVSDTPPTDGMGTGGDANGIRLNTLLAAAAPPGIGTGPESNASHPTSFVC